MSKITKVRPQFLVAFLALLSTGVATTPQAAGAEPSDLFKDPSAAWVTTGRGIACPSSQQMIDVEAALATGDMERFHALAAGCIAPEAGFEIRIIDLAANGPSTFLLVNGTDMTGPWYAGRIFFAPGNRLAP